MGEVVKEKRFLSLLRQAVKRYGMIEEGDRIVVGVSGGKDSMALLWGMRELSRFYPKDFEVMGVMVDLGFGFRDGEEREVWEYCKGMGVELEVVRTQIGRIVMEERGEKNPCSLCAKMRKGALVERALLMGGNKIAYAHHKDDFVETMLLSLLFQGRFYAFPPVTEFEDTRITVIRPMMLMEEGQVRGFCKRYQVPVMGNGCPVDGKTKRAYVKELLSKMQREHPGVKERMFHALMYGGIEDWPEEL